MRSDYFFKSIFSSFSLHRIIIIIIIVLWIAHWQKVDQNAYINRWIRWVLFFIVSLCRSCCLWCHSFISMVSSNSEQYFPRIVAFAVLLRCLRCWFNDQCSHPWWAHNIFYKNPLQFMHFPNIVIINYHKELLPCVFVGYFCNYYCYFCGEEKSDSSHLSKCVKPMTYLFQFPFLVRSAFISDFSVWLLNCANLRRLFHLTKVYNFYIVINE